MSWTVGRWPVGGKLSTPTNLLTCANELRTELQARVAGTALDAFAQGKSLWNAIDALRTKFDAAIAAEAFHDRITGLELAPIGAEPGAGQENVWNECFPDEGRGAWLNLIDGTEAVTPNWRPDERSDPQKFLLNELYAVIDRVCRRTGLVAVADAAINGQYHAYDYGGSANNEVAYFVSDHVRRSLVRFDLSGISASEVLSATLRITWHNNGIYQVPNVRIAQLLREWNEGTGNGTPADAGDATWDSAQHGTLSWTAGGADSEGNDRGAFGDAQAITVPGGQELDVTDIVKAWLEDAESNYGFLLACETESGATNYLAQGRTRTYGTVSARPTLTVNYL